MVSALFVVGALAMPVTGLLIRPDVRWARHGTQMFADLGSFAWYGYLAVSVVLLTVGLVRHRRGTPRDRRRAAGEMTPLLTLTLIFGALHVLFVAKGLGESGSDDQPWLAAVSAVVGVAAALALVFARGRLRRAPAQ